MAEYDDRDNECQQPQGFNRRNARLKPSSLSNPPYVDDRKSDDQKHCDQLPRSDIDQVIRGIPWVCDADPGAG